MSLCKFGRNQDRWSFETCQKFKRSFTTSGVGYTYNNDIASHILKNPNAANSNVFVINTNSRPVKMEISSPDNPLEVIVENNMEEVDQFKNTQTSGSSTGDLSQKPRKVKLVLHNPVEPTNIRSNSFEVPLGIKGISK